MAQKGHIMTFYMTLVASGKSLTVGHIAGVERFCNQQGIAVIGAPEWLHRHRAADLPIASCLTHAQMEILWDALKADQIDVFCTPAEGRQKKLLLADMDATIVTTETLDELAVHAGIGEKIAAITTRAMNGEIDFHAALTERVALLKGLSESVLTKTLAETSLTPGADILLSTLNKHQVPSVLVSGGFTFFTSAIARRAGFTAHHGNTLEIETGALTGRVIPPILDKNAKLNYLKEYAEKNGLSLKDTMAVGDGANDLPMLLAAGLGFGYRPKKLVRESLNNWIFYADLSAILYAQGYGVAD